MHKNTENRCFKCNAILRSGNDTGFCSPCLHSSIQIPDAVIELLELNPDDTEFIATCIRFTLSSEVKDVCYRSF